MDDAEWARLSAGLRRVLSVEDKAFPAIATDEEPVASTWLVVRLQGIHGIRKTKSKQERVRRIGDVLESVALLYEKGSSGTRALRVAFWTRVVTSGAMRDCVWKSKIAPLAQTLARRPVCILLDWSQLAMTVSDISSILASLFRRSAQVMPPMTIGLQLAGCRVTPAGLATLEALWTESIQLTHPSMPTIATNHIGRMDLRGRSLSHRCVGALVALLRRHHVWDLCLSLDALAQLLNVVSIDEILSNTKKLSLGRSLSTGGSDAPASAWSWLARGMFRVTAANTTDDQPDPDPLIELDLGDITVSDDDIVCFRNNLFTMVMDTIQGGEERTDLLWVRLMPTAKVFAGPSRGSVQPSAAVLDMAVEYRVAATHAGGWMRILLPEAEEQDAWVPIEAVAAFRSGDQTRRLCPRFSSFVLHKVTTSPTYGFAVRNLIATVGTHMCRLSVRSNYVDSLAIVIVQQCSRLTHLALHNADIMNDLNRFGGEASLRRLRQLSLHPISWLAFHQLNRFVIERPALETVEITHEIRFSGYRQHHLQYETRCQRFVATHDGHELDRIALVPRTTKLAFLSVPMVEQLAISLVENVWAFAASRVRRRVRSHHLEARCCC